MVFTNSTNTIFTRVGMHLTPSSYKFYLSITDTLIQSTHGHPK